MEALCVERGPDQTPSCGQLEQPPAVCLFVSKQVLVNWVHSCSRARVGGRQPALLQFLNSCFHGAAGSVSAGLTNSSIKNEQTPLSRGSHLYLDCFFSGRLGV